MGTLRCGWAIAIAALLTCAKNDAYGATPPVEATARLDRIGIVVRNTERTLAFLTSILGFRSHPMIFGIEADSSHSGGLKLRFVEGNGIWYVLIEPTSAGPGQDELNLRGDGAMSELDIEVDNLDAAIDRTEKAGVPVVNWDGKPFANGERGWTIQPYGLRLVYLESRGSKGIPIEVYQRGPIATDLLHKRDRMFAGEPDADPIAPRLSHITVLVRDIDATADFLSSSLKFRPRSPSSAREGDGPNGSQCLMVDANGPLLELVQPAPDSPEMRVLESKGDGFLAEMVYSVSNLHSFRQQLESTFPQSRAATQDTRIVGCAARQRPDSSWAIPLVISGGMRVTMIERP
jgi:catechol 2,3-dioxygenase-like lactoylglutathione lyase family enzyme